MTNAMQGKEAESLIAENYRRLEATDPRRFNPYTGGGSPGARTPLRVDGCAIPLCLIPETMAENPFVRALAQAGDIDRFIAGTLGTEPSQEAREQVERTLHCIRCMHDFPYWAATNVNIKAKGGGGDILFRLNNPQRVFVEALERERLAGKPLRFVLLKARQWGGSTCSQLYMAWLQLMHGKGLNSLIIAHQVAASDEIKQMFTRMMAAYPDDLLWQGVSKARRMEAKGAKMVGVGNSGAILKIPARNCTLKIGTAERPDGARGGDYNLVHLSEVGLWKKTDGKKPEDIVRSACSGVLYAPGTMIVYESTANGTGNFFYHEYMAAKEGTSQFKNLFIGWQTIEIYRRPFESEEQRLEFAESIVAGKGQADAPDTRHEPGQYLWSLWEKGATLEGLHWYVTERAKYNSHASMAAEYPSDDNEAFVHSGEMVFDKLLVEALGRGCRPPSLVGDMEGGARDGEKALENVHFSEDAHGPLKVWEKPEPDPPGECVSDRYLVVVDVGGRGSKADWSVAVVFDRIMMQGGGRPEVVAQWRGHIDMDLLAWKAAQLAKWYNDALLVIESNTLETHDRDRNTDGDQSNYILTQIKSHYPNLYHRRQDPEEIRQGMPRKYGFHTNVRTKPMVVSELVRAVRDGDYVEREQGCLDEMLDYERKPNGSYGAKVGAHDDMVMTRAIGLYVSRAEMPLPHQRPLPVRGPRSFAGTEACIS